MSDLFSKFAGFPVLVNPREAPWRKVREAILSLENAKDLSITDTTALILSIDADTVYDEYREEFRRLDRKHRDLSNSIHNISFIRFKQVIGDDDYV